MSRFRRGRSRRASSPVTESRTTARKRSKCKGCGLTFEKGDLVVRLRLRKTHREPCATCGHRLLGVRFYHPSCVPADVNKAMGYDPSKHVHNAPPAAATVPPPPKPPTPHEAALSALVSLEHALTLKLARDPRAWVTVNDAKTGRPKRVLAPEHEKAHARLQGIKARVLRPGTPAEGEVATSLALQQLVKMVFS